MKQAKNQIVGLIRAQLPELPKAQQRVAKYIIDNPEEVIFYTVGQIAQRADTSTATVVRLANSLGFSGYSDFQHELQSAVRPQFDPANRLARNKRAGSQSALISDIMNRQLANLDELIKTVNESDIYRTAELIETAIFGGHAVYICGNRSCYAAASYFSYNLSRMFGNGYLLSAETVGFTNTLNQIRPGDVLVAISLMRYVRSTVETEQIARSRGANVIAITDSTVSPLADDADILFKVPCETLHFHNSLVAVNLLMEALIGVLTDRNQQMVQQHLEEQEKLLAQMKIHIL